VSVKHLNQRQLAERRGVCEGSPERWRTDGIGPVFLKIQGRVLDRLEDVKSRYRSQPLIQKKTQTRVERAQLSSRNFFCCSSHNCGVSAASPNSVVFGWQRLAQDGGDEVGCQRGQIDHATHMAIVDAFTPDSSIARQRCPRMKVCCSNVGDGYRRR
jgi:hypothetical protein